MTTKFSQFPAGNNIIAGDVVVGLRNGINTQFIANYFPIQNWTTLTVSQALLPNEGYILANAAPASYSLPTVMEFGQSIQLASITAQVCTITQAAGQQIQFGNLATTLGVGGSIATSAIGDSLTLVCTVANTTFIVLSGSMGNWTIT